MNNYDDIKL